MVIRASFTRRRRSEAAVNFCLAEFKLTKHDRHGGCSVAAKADGRYIHAVWSTAWTTN